MADTPNLEAKLDEREEDREYEAPKLEVVGTVQQLTSEADQSEPPK